MSVKLIAVDMDGTFLNDKKTYNRERFRQQYARMKEQQIIGQSGRCEQTKRNSRTQHESLRDHSGHASAPVAAPTTNSS